MSTPQAVALERGQPGPRAETPHPHSASGYASIALVSAAVMLYEIGITRILSVVLWYHFAFLAVSLAMLGIGAPGVWIALRGAKSRALQRALLVATLAVPLSLVALLQFGGPLPQRAAFATVCILVPMLALGTAVCLLLLGAPGRSVGRMYAADLLGAGVGALAVVPLMTVVPTPALVAGAGALPAVALMLHGRMRTALVLLLALGALLVWNEPLRVRHNKIYAQDSVQLLYERWTPTARLTVVQTPTQRWAFGWGMGPSYRRREVEQLWLDQDGSAGTPITRLRGSPRDLDYLFDDVTSVVYQLGAADRVCVIGAGGGRDVLTALASGARSVDAVELNPGIIDLVSRRFGEFSGDPYHLPGVHAVASEGRSFLTRSRGGYDVIQISLIDSWAATSAGAYTLSENYLYTQEAYRLYWNRLSDRGVISTTRWLTQLEGVRLAHMLRGALGDERVDAPEQHVAMVSAGHAVTVLASRVPFTGEHYDALVAACGRRGFHLIWPAEADSAAGAQTLELLQQGPEVLRSRGIDLSPPRDDRPFFFHTVAVFGHVDAQTARTLDTAQSVLVLRMLMVIVSAAALALFFSPFLLRRALPPAPEFWRGSAYFAAIGMAFMLIEIPTLQRLVLYLGHPSFATTIGLAALLLGAGLGAFVAGRVQLRCVGGSVFLIPAGIIAASVILRLLMNSTIGWPWPARAASAFAIAAAMGVRPLAPALYVAAAALLIGSVVRPASPISD